MSAQRTHAVHDAGWAAPLDVIDLGVPGVRAAFTGRVHGDARAVVKAADRHVQWLRQVQWLHQVHGATVVAVSPGDVPGREGDALVTSDPIGLAVLVADCAPVILASGSDAGVGVIAAVHCGWRGVVAGVIPAAVEMMRSRGATGPRGTIGPCIGPECYEFGEEELNRVEAMVGGAAGVRGRTADGALALDLRCAVRGVLEAAGVEIAGEDRRCTACDEGFFSARVRGDVGRQAGLVWREA